MHADQQPYRELYDAIMDDEPTSENLASWIERNPGEVEWLQAFRSHSGPTVPVSTEDLWRLYALSRVIQLLTLPFQRGRADGSAWAGPEITASDLSSFVGDLGMTVVAPEHFSPFDCEIVTAVQGAERDQPIALTEIHWPALMLGDMLIARAGVSIIGGANWFDATIASTSMLYWALRRKTRPYEDQSHGWGGNSQWRTAFRRDYRVGSKLYYNVEGKYDLADSEPPAREGNPLTRQERIELLTNRCFIVTAKHSAEVWPYDDRIVLDAPRSGH